MSEFVDLFSEHYETSVDACENHLRYTKRYNSVAKLLPGSAYLGFMAELYTSEWKYILKFTFNERLLRMYLDIYPGIVTDWPYRTAVAQYCTCENAKLTIGVLMQDQCFGEVFLRIEESYQDGPLTEERLDFAVRSGIRILRQHQSALSKAARGSLLNFLYPTARERRKNAEFDPYQKELIEYDYFDDPEMLELIDDDEGYSDNEEAIHIIDEFFIEDDVFDEEDDNDDDVETMSFEEQEDMFEEKVSYIKKRRAERGQPQADKEQSL